MHIRKKRDTKEKRIEKERGEIGEVEGGGEIDKAYPPERENEEEREGTLKEKDTRDTREVGDVEFV